MSIYVKGVSETVERSKMLESGNPLSQASSRKSRACGFEFISRMLRGQKGHLSIQSSSDLGRFAIILCTLDSRPENFLILVFSSMIARTILHLVSSFGATVYPWKLSDVFDEARLTRPGIFEGSDHQSAFKSV